MIYGKCAGVKRVTMLFTSDLACMKCEGDAGRTAE